MDPECSTCAELRTWTSGRGPSGLVERLNRMLDLLGHGFGEIPESDPAVAPWSAVPREMITRDVMINGAHLDQPRLSSRLMLRCAACGRTFCQSWVFERGYERWTITDPDGTVHQDW